MIWLAALFIVVPTVELFLLLQLGSWLGPAATFALVVITGVVGGWLAKREGLGVLADLQRELGRGLPPGDRLVEGGMVLVGGLLLITPGVMTDLIGFLLIVPATRRVLAPRLLGWIGRHVDVRVIGDMPRGSSDVEPSVRYREHAGARPRVPHAPSPFSNKFDDLP